MSTKYLGGENILRSAYDPASESLRTTAVASFAGGTVELNISHLTDSIKIGDGVDILQINSDGSINTNITGTLDVNISATSGDNIIISDGTHNLDVNPDGSIPVNTVASPTVSNINLPLANTEYTISINTNTKRFIMQLRERAKLKLSYVAGQSGITYLSMGASFIYSEESLKLNSPLTLYVQCEVANTNIELLQWA